MKTQTKALTLVLAAGLNIFLANNASADATSVIVRFDLPALRNGAKLSTLNFGSGFEFSNYYITQMFDNSDWAKSYADLGKILTPGATSTDLRGVIRFPNGDPSQTYHWNDLSSSYTNSGVPPSQWLSPDQVLKYFKPATTGYPTPAYQAPIGSEIIFEINAYSMAGSGDSTCYVAYTANTVRDSRNCPTGQAIRNSQGYADFNDASRTGLAKVAQSAANWYRKAVGTKTAPVPLAKQPDYWEIGNEEWIYWTPDQYAEIVNAIGRAIITASGAADINPTRKPLRLLIQSNTKDVYVAGTSTAINNNEWITKVAKGLNDRLFQMGYIHAVSDHRYMSGLLNQSIDARTTDLLYNLDGSETTQIKDLKSRLNDIKSLYNLTTPWQIWVTEYNVFEHPDSFTPSSYVPMQQTQAHGLIMAEWTARMLALGVDRVLPLSADHSPAFALFNYDNNGGTGKAPIMMPGGTAFSKIAKSFVGSMQDVTITGSTQLKAYATYDATTKKLNVLLVNRDRLNGVDVAVGATKEFSPGLYSNLTSTYTPLRPNALSTSNLPPNLGKDSSGNTIWGSYAWPYSSDNPPINWITDASVSGTQWKSTTYIPGLSVYYAGKADPTFAAITFNIPASSMVMYTATMK